MSTTVKLPIAQYPESIQNKLNTCWSSFYQHVDTTQSILENLNTNQLKDLMKVWIASDYVSAITSRNPSLLIELITSGHLLQSYPTDHYRIALTERLAAINNELELMKQLRLFRQQEMTRIIWREITHNAELDETCNNLTLLAEACIQLALEWLYSQHCKQFGTPYSESKPNSEQQLIVLGMGKLGAYELNLSSDIDLIFAYPESGNAINDKKKITNHEFFTKLSQRLIYVLDTTTQDGFVFRVDMRLRPYGSAGAIALNFAAMEAYYQDQGRDWERYAMIKARPVAGDIPMGEQLLLMLKPFVFRRYMDYGAINALRDMKKLINRETKHKGLDDNIKLGSGGIREIEFIVQALQLIRGGRDQRLQQRELLLTLNLLKNYNYLPAQTTTDLAAAYGFLRQVEHALQAFADKQTHQLPRDSDAQLRLTITLGYSTWDSFIKELNLHREKVQYYFAQFITPSSDKNQDHKLKTEKWVGIWQQEVNDNQSIETLTRSNYEDPEKTLHLISSLANSYPVKTMQRIGQERLNNFMPLLLANATETTTPSMTIARIFPLLEAVIRRTAYLVLLIENPGALRQLIMLCHASAWIAEELAKYPILLDELLDANHLATLPTISILHAELEQQLLRIPAKDLERQMECLRHFKRAHVLKAASAETSKALPLMKVSDYLTYLAEVVIQHVFTLAWQQMIDRYGYPSLEHGVATEPNFIIVGYGKLGGIEMGYNSDLDLVFIHDCPTHLATNGDHPIDNSTFFARLGQRIIHIMTTVTMSGKLYDVDVRLRPSGKSGILVTTLQAFTQYQEKEAWTWEHQALVRARVIIGNQQLSANFNKIRNITLSKKRNIAKLRQEVAIMREKMLQEHGKNQASHANQPLFHLKQDPGGIIDIEFIVQFAVLAWSHNHPELLQYTDNIRLLENIADTQILTQKECNTLIEAYKVYRSMIHRLTLQQQPNQVAVAQFKDYRQSVITVWHILLESNKSD